MAEEAGLLEFRLRKSKETRNYLLHEIKHNDFMSKRYIKTCKYLKYVENLLLSVSTVTGCISISAFALLVCAPAIVKLILSN